MESEPFGDAGARCLVHEGAAPGRHHARSAGKEARDHPALAVAEVVFAMPPENVGDRHAGSLDDLLVDVDKGQAEPDREPASDRRFARAHHADKDDRPASQALDEPGDAIVASVHQVRSRRELQVRLSVPRMPSS